MSDPMHADGPSSPSRRLILASASPRRQELLREAGYEFRVEPANIDEDAPAAGIPPVQLAMQLARQKALAVAERFPADLILAADTVVALGDWPIGKPKDKEDAHRILSLLAGTTHIVITGVCIVCLAEKLERTDHAMSAVRMRDLTPGEIQRYIEGGQWKGKAGAYGIQDRDPFVIRTAGSHSNIVGLPMELTRQMLADAGNTPRTPPGNDPGNAPGAPPGAPIS